MLFRIHKLKTILFLVDWKQLEAAFLPQTPKIKAVSWIITQSLKQQPSMYEFCNDMFCYLACISPPYNVGAACHEIIPIPEWHGI